MDSSNSENISQQNDSMAKDYCGLAEEHGDVMECTSIQVSRELYWEGEFIISRGVRDCWLSCLRL